MSYRGISKLSSENKYGSGVYTQASVGFGNPPPQAPDRFLLQEDGFFLLTESSDRIKLET